MPTLAIDALIGDFASLRINAVELNDLVESEGIGVELRRAVWCPCVRIETHTPRLGCPHCRGLRFVYPEKLRLDLVALVLNRNPKRDRVPAGELVTGTAVITFPLGVVPGVGDMILPCGEFHVIHETLWRASQQIDNETIRRRGTQATNDQLPPKITPKPERLLYDKIVQIEHIHWIDQESDKLCIASAADYELVGNEIRWREGRGPAAGDGYSIRYRAQAAYILNPAEPVFRKEGPGGAVFPYRVEGLRLDRWGAESLRSGT